jgi:hypothetical protein
MMGMMFPDSIYCSLEKMHLDSLAHPHDSTYMGWYRFQIGGDSMNYDMMNDSMMGGHQMMQFMQEVGCELHWDSLMTDSMHRSWRPNGVHGWNGTQWISIANVTIDGSDASFSATQQYSAYAFVGAPGGVLAAEENAGLIGNFVLGQNYPNPFNPSTEIRFDLPSAGMVNLKVINILGREVATVLENQLMMAGEHKVIFDASTLPTGVYFYRIQAGGLSDTKKMIFLK